METRLPVESESRKHEKTSCYILRQEQGGGKGKKAKTNSRQTGPDRGKVEHFQNSQPLVSLHHTNYMLYLLNWLFRKKQWRRRGKTSLNTSGYWVSNSFLQPYNILWCGDHRKNTVCELSPKYSFKEMTSGGRAKKRRRKKEWLILNQMHQGLVRLPPNASSWDPHSLPSSIHLCFFTDPPWDAVYPNHSWAISLAEPDVRPHCGYQGLLSTFTSKLRCHLLCEAFLDSQPDSLFFLVSPLPHVSLHWNPLLHSGFVLSLCPQLTAILRVLTMTHF